MFATFPSKSIKFTIKHVRLNCILNRVTVNKSQRNEPPPPPTSPTTISHHCYLQTVILLYPIPQSSASLLHPHPSPSFSYNPLRPRILKIFTQEDPEPPTSILSQLYYLHFSNANTILFLSPKNLLSLILVA